MAKQFIEILNWRKYQERMPDKGATWFKIHTSLSNCEAFQRLDYKAQMQLIALWEGATRIKGGVARCIIKADPKYLYRNCRLLKEEPDLEPLVNAVDDYGKPHPFIRYCDAPGGDEIKDENKPTGCARARAPERGQKRSKKAQSSAQSSAQSKQAEDEVDPLYKNACNIAAYRGYASARNLQIKLRISYARANWLIDQLIENGVVGDYKNGRGFEYLTALEKCNTEREKERKTDSLRNPEEREIERKTESLRTPGEAKPADSQKQQQQKSAEAETSVSTHSRQQKPVEPVNPKDSDVGAVVTHHVPTQPLSAYRSGKAESIGNIIKAQFPMHWDDGECESHGKQVIEILGIPADKSSEYSKGEWGAFARWLFDLKSVCRSTVIVNELKDKMIKKAKWVMSPKCKNKKNPSALLTYIMAGELASQGITLPDSRASPKAVRG